MLCFMPNTSLRERRRRYQDSVPDLSGEDGIGGDDGDGGYVNKQNLLCYVSNKFNTTSICSSSNIYKFLISGRVFPRKYNQQNNIEVMHFHEEAAEEGFE